MGSFRNSHSTFTVGKLFLSYLMAWSVVLPLFPLSSSKTSRAWKSHRGNLLRKKLKQCSAQEVHTFHVKKDQGVYN